MSLTKKIIIGFSFLLILIQAIRPEKNEGIAEGPNDIFNTVNTPEGVRNILRTSCFDCHSNQTNYPWYVDLEPVGWWLANHVNEGKEELNFSEFKTYSAKRRAKKFEEIAEEVNEGEMPMESYLIMHGNAELSPEQKDLLINWARANMSGGPEENEGE